MGIPFRCSFLQSLANTWRRLLACAVILLAVSAAAPPESLILDPREARKANLLVQSNVPYVLKYEGRRGALLFYGAAHSNDPSHPQFADIQRYWEEFGPTVSFNEGRTPCVSDEVNSSIIRGGEAGYVTFLAANDRTPATSFEPPLAAELRALRETFSTEQIAVFYVLRLVAQEGARNPDVAIDQIIVSRLRLLDESGLDGIPTTLAAFSEVAHRLIPDLPDWRRAPRDWFIPSGVGQFTNEIANASANFRNVSLFRQLLQRVRQGERVFVVAGASHAVELEPALSAVFGRPAVRQRGLPSPTSR